MSSAYWPSVPCTPPPYNDPDGASCIWSPGPFPQYVSLQFPEGSPSYLSTGVVSIPQWAGHSCHHRLVVDLQYITVINYGFLRRISHANLGTNILLQFVNFQNPAPNHFDWQLFSLEWWSVPPGTPLPAFVMVKTGYPEPWPPN